jgi:hypothetical protein
MLFTDDHPFLRIACLGITKNSVDHSNVEMSDGNMARYEWNTLVADPYLSSRPDVRCRGGSTWCGATLSSVRDRIFWGATVAEPSRFS